MSGYFGIGGELLYAHFGAATTTTPTAGAVSMIGTYPPIVIPGGYMGSVGSRASSLRFKMGGILSSTASPTWIFGLYLTSVQPPAFATTTTLVVSAAVTPASVSNAWWIMDCDIGLSVIASGAASTVVAAGEIRSQAGFASPFSYSLPTAGAYTPLATWETDLQYFLWPGLTLSAATAGNTVTVQYCKCYGED